MADQVRVAGVQGVAKTPWDLRDEVCNALKYLPNRFYWVETKFGGSFDRYFAFIEHHRRSTVWTDDMGIMCQATALYLGNNML